jgi:cobalt-zinc-cadmium efflux system protein
MSKWRSPHDSQTSQHGKRNALIGAIFLSLVALVLQLFGAWYTSSIALLGDSAHLFTDLLSLVMSLSAVLLAARPIIEGRNSFGLYRLEVLASFVNGLLLLGVALSLAYEGVSRLLQPEPVKSLPLLVVASIGLFFNLASAALLYRAAKSEKAGGFEPVGCAHGHGHDHGHAHDHGHGHHQHSHEDRNLQSALLHVWSDALGSVAVIAGAAVIYFTDFHWVDSAIGLLLALWILRWSVRVIQDAGHVLLESTPRHVKTSALVAEMRGLDQRVSGVEDLHVWELTSRMYAATADVWVTEMTIEQAEALRERMHHLMRERFGIAHVVLAIRPK